MDKNSAWENFKKTGKINDYLNYRKVSDNKEKNAVADDSMKV